MKNENEIKNFIINKNFFHPSYNPDGKNFHHFCEKNDEIIFDYATKLYWQRGGSGNIPYCNFPSHHFRETAISYVEKLKKIEFGGFSDWRIPTLEECLSLFHPEFSFYKSPYSDLPEKIYLINLFSMEIGDTYTSTPKTSGIGGLWICDWRDKARIDYFTNGYNTHVKAVRG